MSSRLGVDRFGFVIWVLVGAMVILIVTPIVFLLYGSFATSATGQRTGLSLSNYVEAFSSIDTLSLTVNTLVYAFGSACLAVALATVLSIIATRTDTPFRGFFRFMPLMNLIVPGFVTVIGWVYLLSPVTGLINRFFISLGAAGPLLNIYSLGGMIWATGTNLVPISFLVIAAAMQNMDSSLEEASRIAGGKLKSTLLRITLPLILPAIFSAFLLVFVSSIESFEIPAMIGARASIFVYMSDIYRAINWTVPPNFGLATARGVLILVITLVLVYVYRLSVKRTERFQIITGRGYRSDLIKLGKWKWFTFAFGISYFVVVMLMPFITIIISSFHPFWEPDNLFGNLTLDAYTHLSLLHGLIPAALNSLYSSAIAATLTVVIAALIAFITHRTKVTGRGILEGIGMLPLGFPGLVLGIGLLWTFVLFPSFLYGTIAVLILAYMIRFMPYGIRTVSGQIVQVSHELDEASKVSGASTLRTLRSITFPLLKPALISAWVYTFTVSFRELSASVLLITQNTNVIAPILFSLWTSPKDEPALAAACVVLVASLWIVVVVATRLSKVSLSREVAS